MIINGYTPNNLNVFTSKKKLVNNSISFVGAPKYKVKNSTFLNKILPVLAFTCSVLGATGYLTGGLGLFYDSIYDKKNIKNLAKTNNAEKTKSSHEGVQTIIPSTKIGKIGINCAKMAITATATAGMACGLGEGIPLMAIGEATNFSSARIIETPVGTGLFGIGIASIFAGLALDNTPELKLNELDLMAAKGLSAKSKLIFKNIKDTAKEIGSSVFQIVKNVYKPSFWKDDIFRITPKTIVFSEKIDKDGVITLTRELRHKKNYLMHAASFTLAVGGLGIVLTSALNKKKAQKRALQVEEGGFLFDNFGMTKYGIDKFTTSGKSTGASFAIGGIINAISQFIGLDNKDGRALQWLGIAGVFLGYSIDRGKHLKKAIENSKARESLTRVVREWKIDLSQAIKDKKELNSLLKEIRLQSAAFIEGKEGNEIPKITNNKFVAFEEKIRNLTEGEYKDKNYISTNLSKDFQDMMSHSSISEIKNKEDAINVLKYCSNKIFGENPVKVPEKPKK